MHIPDGFLSPPVWAALDIVSLPAVGLVARRIQKESTHSRAPLLGVLGAFVFAAQMINFPVAPGTSAHLLGGALLACTLGPASAVIVMTAVLVVQALVFQDGGLLALGANIFNLAIAGVAAAWIPYSLLSARAPRLAVFLAGVCSVMVSGCLALLELVASGIPVPVTLLYLAVGFFGVSAILEGAITLGVLQALGKMNPEWVRRPEGGGKALRVLLVASVLIAATGFLVASAMPDSLESLATHLGIDEHEFTLAETPFADYRIAGVPSESLARAAAGLTGLGLVFAACLAASRLLHRRS